MPEPRKRAARRRRVLASTPLLAVDVGNSETTVGRFTGRDLDGFWRLTSGRHTADEIRYILEALLKTPAAGWGAVVCSCELFLHNSNSVTFDGGTCGRDNRE